MATSSPTVRRRRLGRELRRLRDAAGKTIADVAEAIGCGANTITRYETGPGKVKLPYVEAMLTFYGVEEPEKTALLKVARESRQKGWWHSYGDVLPDWFEDYVGLEEAASTLRFYEEHVIHGLLQTEDYARAVYRTLPSGPTDEDIDRLATLRMNRQNLLTRRGGPSAWFVLDEAAIRRRIAPAYVMREQMEHLIQTARLPNVEVQVLPQDSELHCTVRGPFVIISFAEQDEHDVVYLEALTSSFYLEDREETEPYTLVFDHLRAAALSLRASADLLASVAKEMT